MGFGRNPHVSKAVAAEEKAESAESEDDRAQAWRDAGRLWERAASRERDDKRRTQYTENAQRAHASADGDVQPDPE